MPVSDKFWTDDVQAAERLLESYILKDNKEIVRVVEVRDGNIHFRHVKNDTERHSLPMNSPSWNKFRSLPALGWINVVNEGKTRSTVHAVYVRRNAVKARTHGLSATNCFVYDFLNDIDALAKSRLFGLNSVFAKGTYEDDTPFPNFDLAYRSLKNQGSIALSSIFAMYKDRRGIVWLYRKRKCIGIVPDIKTLLLGNDAKFYREDIEESKIFTFDTIREF